MGKPNSKSSETQDDFDWLNEDDDRFTATMWEQSDGSWLVKSEGSQYDSFFTKRFADSVDANIYMDKVNRGELDKQNLYDDEMDGYRSMESKASEVEPSEYMDDLHGTLVDDGSDSWQWECDHCSGFSLNDSGFGSPQIRIIENHLRNEHGIITEAKSKASELFGQNDPNEILGGTFGTPEDTANDAYNMTSHNYSPEEYFKWDEKIIDMLGRGEPQFDPSSLDSWLRSNGVSEDLIYDLIREWGRGTRKVGESKATEFTSDDRLSNIWNNMDTNQKSDVLEYFEDSDEFVGNNVDNDFYSIARKLGIASDKFKEDVEEFDYLINESKASESDKTFTCEFCGKVGNDFSDMAQEICPENAGNGHQIPIFGDMKTESKASEVGTWADIETLEGSLTLRERNMWIEEHFNELSSEDFTRLADSARED